MSDEMREKVNSYSNEKLMERSIAVRDQFAYIDEGYLVVDELRERLSKTAMYLEKAESALRTQKHRYSSHNSGWDPYYAEAHFWRGFTQAMMQDSSINTFIYNRLKIAQEQVKEIHKIH